MNETQTIQAKYGPYAGTQITVAAKIAKRAIKDGWAFDPYAAPAEEEPYDEAKALAAQEAANAAAAVLRGEAPAEGEAVTKEAAAPVAEEKPAEEPKKKIKPEDPLKAATRSLEAEKPSGGYETRSAKK